MNPSRLNRHAVRGALAGLLAALVPLGCGGSGRAAQPGRSAESAVITVPFDGCLGAPVSVVTPHGVRLTLAAGTCLTTAMGEVLRGSVVVGLDEGGADAAHVAALADAEGPAPSLATRVYVHLVRRDGSRVPVNAMFAPSATLDLAALLPTKSDDTWHVRHVESPPAPPGTPPAGSPSGAAWEVRQQDDVGLPGVGSDVPVGAAGHLVGHVETPPALVAKPRVATTHLAPVVGELDLGPAGSNTPVVVAARIVAAGTSNIVGVQGWQSGLVEPGTVGLVYHQGVPAFEIEIVEEGGRRLARIRSTHSNALRCYLQLAPTPDAIGGPPVVVPVAGSPGEADTGGTYVGHIDVEVCGCGGYDEFMAAVAVIGAALGDPDDASVSRFESEPGSGNNGYVGRVTVAGFGGSVRNLAGLLPGTWQFTFGDRRLKIEIPCPPPISCVITEFPPSLAELDPSAPLLVPPLMPLLDAPFDGSLLWGGTVYLAVPRVDAPVPAPGRIDVIDLPARTALAPLAAPDLVSGLGLHPAGTALWFVSAVGGLTEASTSTGQPTRTLGLLPQVAPGQRCSDVALSADGGTAFVVDPSGGMHVVDLLRGEDTLLATAPGASAPTVSPDGTDLALLLPAAGQVLVFDLLLPAQPPLALGLFTNPSAALWLPAGRGLMVANGGGATLVQHDPLTFAPIPTPVPPGPRSLAAYLPPGATDPRLIVASGVSNQLALGPVVNPGVPAVLAPLPAPPLPYLVRLPGR
jgi:hypothetical protein